jgi:NAD(P)-dependent dehydrogenase (short-subunit alcohol dehydrogenase family)
VFAGEGYDILVNNAGIIRRADALDFTEADWDAVMDVNLKAVFFTAQAFARAAARGARGGSSTSPRCCRFRAASACRPTRRPSTGSRG